MKKGYLFTFFLSALLGISLHAQTVITQWNFDSETLTPNIGAGTASNVGGTSTAFASGVSGQGWQTSSYPSQGEDSGEAGVEFEISTVGYENIQLEFQHRSSGTGSRYAEVQYSTDGGSNWLVLDNNNGGLSPNDVFYGFTFDFSSCVACNDNPDFVVRIVSIFAPCDFVQNATLTYNANEAYMRSNTNAQCQPHSTGNTGNYNGGGTWRFDDVTISGDVIATAQSFYSKPTGDLNELSTWGDQPNGTGTEPANFTDANQTFFIHNNLNPTISANWEVSGAGSSVVVGDGTANITFTVPSAIFFTGSVAVEDNGTLVLSNATIPSLGSLSEGSTVVYTENAVGIAYHSYHNLVFDNIDPVFSGDGELIIGGDFTLLGTVNMPDARDEDEYDITYNGSGNQTISGNGNAVRAYTASINKNAGTIALAANTVFSTDNQINFVLESPAVFQDNGNTMHAGNSVEMAGDQAAYELTGTLILDDFATGIVKGSGDGNNFNIRESSNNNNIVAELNNVIIRAVNEGGQFRFRDGSTDLITIKGDFIVEEQVEGAVRFYGNTLEVMGDFVIEENFLGSFTNDISHLVFNGTANQIFSNGYVDFEVTELTIDNANELILNDPLFVSDAINFESGLIVSTASNGLYLMDEVGVIGASASSYVDGPFFIELDTDVATFLTFPVGKAGAYRPVTLNVNQSVAQSTWYHAEVIDGASTTFLIGPGLDAVSAVRHYEIGQTDVVNIDALTLTLNYDSDDNVSDPLNLRIANEQSNEWVNLGGAGTGSPAGSITTSNAFSTLGLFVLADAEAGTQNDPEIIVNINELSGFSQLLGSPSAEISFTVQGVFLEGDITITAPAEYEISTSSGSGFTNQIVLEETNGIVGLTTIYVHLNAPAVGTYTGEITLTSQDADNVEVAVSGQTFESVQPGEDLVYYWHFNDMDPDADDVTAIEADYSLIPGFTPFMTYTGTGNRDIDAYDPGTTINAQMGEPEGLAARVRNSADGRSLLFNLNTQGVEKMVFEYAVHRSGNGMLQNNIDYSTDGGLTYSQDFLLQTTFDITESYELVAVDLTSVLAAENNPDFILRITFSGNTQLTSGNNRYDNITLKGEVQDAALQPNSFANSIRLFPNPTATELNVRSAVEMDFVQIIDVSGKTVFQSDAINANAYTMDASQLNSGMYILRVFGQKTLTNIKFMKQ
jgi:hypothetical protein